MENFFLSYQSSRISYLRFGGGSQAVFCFHGYGEDASRFAFLNGSFDGDLCFYAIDIPYHGKTEWKEKHLFSSTDLTRIIEQLMTQHTQRAGANKKCILLGFSLGGRMALDIYQSVPLQVSRVVLLAPDGLKVNFWYRLSTRTLAGRALFRFTMRRPGWFFLFLRFLNRLGLVNASVFKFVARYIGDDTARRQLYDRWTGLRRIRPDLARIRKLVAGQQTPVRLLYGRHDRIILSVRGEKFREGLEDHISITLLETGHQVLHPKQTREILAALLH